MSTADNKAPAGDPKLPGLANPSEELEQALSAALVAKGASYVPRTRHLLADGAPRFINRLIFEDSPYLLQHAHNPVNWHPWGEAALARAKAEGKLVLLSVGYATCHWCHVMEHESFEDEEIAAAINESFVPIKVDREERPDVDALYMTSVQMLVGQGGWPLTVFLSPDKEPIYGGTYFPPRDGVRGARVGFLTVLRQVAESWRHKREAVTAQAGRFAEELKNVLQPSAPAKVPSAAAIRNAAASLLDNADERWGGFGGAPKFPRPSALELLARYYRRTKDAAALAAVTTTLDRMATGGIYDQVGGGFHRYATDVAWAVPHFEKMLYDNAQLVVAYTEAWQLTGKPRYARVVHETLSYLQREMGTREGGFQCATDADSKGSDGHWHEGTFFTWTAEEVEAVLGKERAKLVQDYYGVTSSGNFEGRNVLHVAVPDEEMAQRLGLSTAELEGMLQGARAELYDARATRPRPLADNKILTSWNALAVSAFARAGFAFGAPSYLLAAETTASFILERLSTADGSLLRVYKDGAARQPAFLDDYAFFIAALLDLYEATWEPRWLAEALRLQSVLDRRFADEAAGGYFFTASDHEELLARDKPTYDGAEPSGNSVALLSLLRLAELTGYESYRARAERGFAAFATDMEERGMALPRMLCALDFYLDEPTQVIVVSPAAGDGGEELVRPLRRSFLPSRVLTAVEEGTASLVEHVRLVPMLAGRQAQGGESTAYLCRAQTCRMPLTDPQALVQELARVKEYAGT